jgi:hypothetical protein
MIAVALDKQELEDYHWWINSQQDPSKFKWSSPDKAGTEPIPDLASTIKRAQVAFGKSTIGPERMARILGRPIVYYDGNKFYDEQNSPIVMTDDLMGQAVVIRKSYGAD